jgi:NitT/TauT family transport system permease protein
MELRAERVDTGAASGAPRRSSPYLPPRAFALVLALLLWEALAHAAPVVFAAVASPTAVAATLWQLLRSGAFGVHFVSSAAAAVFGTAVGAAAGALAGLLPWAAPPAVRLARPVLAAIGAAPAVALAPLVLLWCDAGAAVPMAMAAFPVALAALHRVGVGADAVAAERMALLRELGASRRQLLGEVFVPGALDQLLRRGRALASLGLVGACTGEFLAARAGLGHLLLQTSRAGDVAAALASATALLLLALVLDSAAGAAGALRTPLLRRCGIADRLAPGTAAAAEERAGGTPRAPVERRAAAGGGHGATVVGTIEEASGSSAPVRRAVPLLPPAPEATAAPPREPFELVLPGGLVIRVPQEFTAPALQSLLAALRQS